MIFSCSSDPATGMVVGEMIRPIPDPPQSLPVASGTSHANFLDDIASAPPMRNGMRVNPKQLVFKHPKALKVLPL